WGMSVRALQRLPGASSPREMFPRWHRSQGETNRSGCVRATPVNPRRGGQFSQWHCAQESPILGPAADDSDLAIILVAITDPRLECTGQY
ncbi:MAG: hypothetical protein K0U93_17310, partial [Gammaproteobacteria bacterium]|nr:hypothetical protein [Gammaproteobacteria bacterium]